jgi:hypothetical protein
MTKRSLTVSIALAVTTMMAFAILKTTPAGAVVFNMGGPGGPAGVDMNTASALFVSGHDGSASLIAQNGAVAPGGDIFSDMGVPSISPEGDVVFGAETLGMDQQPRWDIYRANVNAPANRRIVRLLDNVAMPDGCHPNFKTDPYPVAGSDGVVVFLAPEASGKDAVFRYQDGHLACAAHVGDRTAEGHSLKLLYFGSADIASDGTMAFVGRVTNPEADNKGTAVVIALDANSTMHEVAREGEPSPGGGHFGPSFGRPAIVRSRDGDLIAFSNRTSKMDAFYIANGRHLARSFATGSRTRLGVLTYISDGKPALLADGTVIFTGASHQKSAVFKAKDGELTMLTEEGGMTQFGTRLAAFVDPSVTAAGLVYLAGHDDRGAEHLFVFESSNGLRVPVESAADVTSLGRWMPAFFPGSLAMNEEGDIATLGAAPNSDPARTRTIRFEW